MSAALLRAEGLVFSYRPGQPVLRGVDLVQGQGGFTCLLGPNGSGKTTLLRCLLGQLIPQQGQILLQGAALASVGPRQRARVLAYVPQFPSSAFAFTVQELVAMGRLPHQGALALSSAQDLDRVRQALERTDTLAFAQRSLAELSGGEAQRVMISRALAQEPALMLLDEPTAHLDLRNQLRIYQLLGTLARQDGVAVVCVSHDINVAARFADRLVLLHDGQILAEGPPAEVLQADLLARTYGVVVELLPTADGVPMVRALAP